MVSGGPIWVVFGRRISVFERNAQISLGSDRCHFAKA